MKSNLKKQALALACVGAFLGGVTAPVTEFLPEAAHSVAHAAITNVWACTKCNQTRAGNTAKPAAAGCPKGGAHNWVKKTTNTQPTTPPATPATPAPTAKPPLTGFNPGVGAVSQSVSVAPAPAAQQPKPQATTGSNPSASNSGEKRITSKKISYGSGQNTFTIRPVKGKKWTSDSFRVSINFGDNYKQGSRMTCPPGITVYDAATGKQIAKSDPRSITQVIYSVKNLKGTDKAFKLYFTVNPQKITNTTTAYVRSSGSATISTDSANATLP